MLTGKCKEQFEDFCKIKYNWSLYNKSYLAVKDGDSFVIYFSELPFSMQLGVYLEYFDSIESEIDVLLNQPNEFKFIIWNNNIHYFSEDDGKLFLTRQEAYKEAFKQLNELINK